MNKNEVISGLNQFRERLTGEVLRAFEQRGAAFGRDRFQTWRRKFSQFLEENMPGEVATLNGKLTHYAFVVHRGESDAQRFWREDGENMLSYIDSRILDVENDEYDLPETDADTGPTLGADEDKMVDCKKVFLVHGHDGEAKERTARFLEKLGYEPIILQEQASRGLTIIEKIEKYSNVKFAIVLYTPDDMGNVESEAKDGNLLPRARQNVVFEHGYLIGRIGRDRVVPLVAGSMELPTDISGIVYISDKNWQVDVAKEMKDAGYEIDFNKLL